MASGEILSRALLFCWTTRVLSFLWRKEGRVRLGIWPGGSCPRLKPRARHPADQALPVDNTAGHLSSPGVPPKSFWPGRPDVGLRTGNQCFRASSFHGAALHGAPGSSGCSSLLYPVATPGRYCEGGAGVVSPQPPHISSAGQKNAFCGISCGRLCANRRIQQITSDARHRAKQAQRSGLRVVRRERRGQQRNPARKSFPLLFSVEKTRTTPQP